MKMILKVDDKGNVVVKNGMPVYVYDDGKEIEFDANRIMAKVTSLNDENKTHREENTDLKKKLEGFADLDPVAAKKALVLLKNIDQKKLIDAGEVEKVKAEIGEAFKGQITELTGNFEKKVKGLEEAVTAKDTTIYGLMVSGRFASSDFVNKKLALPSAKFAEAVFGKNFKVEDGKLVPYNEEGKRIMSRKDPTALADFDEAMELIVEGHPDKAKLLRGTAASGSGKTPGDGSGSSQPFVISRADATDVAKYSAAKEAAQKAGVTLQIEAPTS